MVLHYVKLFQRHFKKNPGAGSISLASLALGISCTVIILLFIDNELKYDRFHKNKDLLFRVSMKMTMKDGGQTGSAITAAVGPDLFQTFPEVENYCRIRTRQAVHIGTGEKNFLDNNLRYCDSTFFDIFSFNLLLGDPHTALSRPYSMVLEESFAARLFPGENAMGKTVILNGKEAFIITGIVEAPPTTSHIRFNNLASFSTLYEDARMHMGWNGGWQYETYILLNREASITSLVKKMEPFMYDRINQKYEASGARMDPVFEPITRVYLHSAASDSGTTGSVGNIIIFSSISFFILMLACINFVNLGTAHGSLRAREIAVRKVFGGQKSQLTIQFLGESVVMSFAALIVSIFIIGLFLPPVNRFIFKNLILFDWSHWYILLSLPVVALAVGLLAGGYPSVYLSAFQPLQILKGNIFMGLGRQRVRNILVLLQFFISAILIITTLGINKQLRFLVNKDPGFDKENKMLIPLVSDQAKNRHELLIQEIKNIQGVVSVGASSNYPGRGLTSNGYVPEGFEEPVMIHVLDVDFDFLKTYGMTYVAGREFSRDFPSDENAYLVNEALVREFGWDNAVGKSISRGGPHEIIGVVKDFHFAPLDQVIQPLIFTMKPYMGFDYLTIDFHTENLQKLIEDVQGKWKKLDFPENFRYRFLSDELKMIYDGPKKMSQLLMFLTLLAIFIACMGLYGLASFSNRQRIKEIGLRKVMGASNRGIVVQLLKEFSLWVLAANFIAWPVAWYIIRHILNMSAFRIPMPYMIFAGTAIASIVLAWITVGYQSYRAAIANPADSLRRE